jgi:arylsulfatase A-like enzyme
VIAGGDSGGHVVNRWIRQQLREVTAPTFLFVNYLECHWSYTPPRSIQRKIDGPRYGYLRDLRYRLELADRVGPWEAIARADRETLDVYSTLYDAEHRNVDAHLADLLDILREAGRLRDGRTLVIVTSDHGEHIGERGLADHHASLDDYLVHVPFVAWGPDLVPEGERDGTYEFVDVFPSLCKLLQGEPSPPQLAGRRTDLFVENGSTYRGELAFAEWRAWPPHELKRLSNRNPSYDFSALARDLVCVRDSQFKLVRSSDGTETLYDLANDPHEEHDDAGLAHPDALLRLQRALDTALETWGAWSEKPAELSEEDRAEIEAHLGALGYI